MRWAVLTLILLFAVPVHGVTLTGTVYDEELSIAPDTIVELDTGQRMLSNGTYRFDVAPGNHTITATRRPTGVSVTESVAVPDQERFQFDLFLLEGLEDDPFLDEVGNMTEDVITTGEEGSELLGILTRLAIVLAIFGAGYLVYRYFTRDTEEVVDEFFKEADDIERVRATLSEAGGRMTQKALRQTLPDSEAKISLLLAEMEKEGLIKKVKQGRGNIIILK